MYFSKVSSKMLVELFELQLASDGNQQLNECARWFKYEEDVEGVDRHRGRPHVSFLSFASVQQLKKLLSNGILFVDHPLYSMQGVVNLINSVLISDYNMNENIASRVATLLSAKRIRCNQELRYSLMTQTSAVRRLASTYSKRSVDMSPNPRKTSKVRPLTTVTSSIRSSSKTSQDSSLTASSAADIVHVCCGSLDGLDEIRLIVIRFQCGMYFPEITDHIAHVRFIVLIVGPAHSDANNYVQIGRALCTLMANEKFCQAALQCDNNGDKLINELDSIMNDSLVLMPIEIDSKDLFTVDSARKATDMSVCRLQSVGEDRKTSNTSITQVRHRKQISISHDRNNGSLDKIMENLGDVKFNQQPNTDPFERTKRPFGGAINDIKNRLPYYFDDFKTALNFQCVTSVFFIFFANFASAIAIGEVLSSKTDGWMGVSEILIAHGVCGVIWGLIAGQPLCIQAAVGPFMVFEESLYKFCKSAGVDFLAFRIWTSLWSFLMLILCALFEAPCLMRYMTKFTEEIFTCLIAIIFVVEAGKFMYKEFNAHPLKHLATYCDLFSKKNQSIGIFNKNIGEQTFAGFDSPSNVTAYDRAATSLTDQPDTALLQFMLLLITFGVAYVLKKLRFSIYCSHTVRKTIGDFGVPLAVVVGTLVDRVVFSDTYTRHIHIKSSFDLTRPDLRGWFVHPLGNEETFPTWAIPAAIIPAILVTILLFAEVEIIEKLLTKKEVGLKKPTGFHWDLIVVGGSAVICSLFGLQWMCPAAVQSLSHANSLAVMTKTVPGEVPRIDYVVEQRFTAILIGLLHAAAAFCGVALTLIPVSVLFGLFLYLGVVGLLGVQIWQRFVLFFVPKKYFPNEPFCQQVTAKRLHLYTFIQVFCLVCLWIINMFPSTALAFPFVLIIIAAFRKYFVSKIFTEDELISIEGLQPKCTKTTTREDNDFFFNQNVLE